MPIDKPHSTINHPQLARDLLAANPALGPKLETNCQVPPTQVLPLLTEVIRFLNLVALAGHRLTPSLAVDNAWHEFILHTQSYWDFCHSHFDRIIHHHPGGAAKENQSQFARTLKLYQTHFGPPPSLYWQENETDCGPCQST